MQSKFEFYKESKREGNMLGVSHQGGEGLQAEMLLSPKEKGPKWSLMLIWRKCGALRGQDGG